MHATLAPTISSGEGERTMGADMLRRIIGLLFCAWTVVTPPASGETLYGADGAQGNPSNLYTLDPTSGAVLSTVGAIGFAVTGLAIHPGTRVMYGATANADGVISPRSLITINKSTGSGSLLGPFLLPDGPQTLTDLTFTSDGTLYGLGSHDGQLYTVNLATGAATVVGESGVGSPLAVGSPPIRATRSMWRRTPIRGFSSPWTARRARHHRVRNSTGVRGIRFRPWPTAPPEPSTPRC